MKKSYGFFITGIILVLSFVSISLSSSVSYKIVSAQPQLNPADGDSIAIKIRAIGNHYISQHGNVGLVIGIYRQRTNPNIPVPPEIYSFGHVRNDTNSPVPDSLTFFKLGSTEKTFCATILAKIILDTSLHVKLNDLINKYLPDTLRLPRYIDTTVTPHDTTFISLVDLATHYSALPDTLWNSVVAPGYTLQLFYEFLESYYDSLRYSPGSGYNYSNPGFGLLGDICSMVRDTTYGEAAYQIFSELGMFNTKIILTPADTPRVAQGHGRNGELIPHYLRAPSPALEGAGAHFSTVKDMLRFLAFNLGFLQTPLNNTRDTLHKWRKQLGHNPDAGQGLAWQIVKLYPNSVVYNINKNGDTPDGYTSYIAFRQETKTGVIVMSNSTNSPDSVGNVVMRILNPLPMGINVISGEVPEGFRLEQNYPNPFNPSTIIRYSLIENGFVTLKVYDVLGNEVATLVNEKQNPGTYSYQLSTVNYQLSSGLYFYKLESGNFTETRSMVLIK